MHTTTLREIPKSISEIMAYEHNALLDRYVKDYGGTRERAVRCFQALKQFLTVCSPVWGLKAASESVDDMWHTFLLFTRDYQNFCDEYLGRFIHHQPAAEGLTPDSYTAARALVMELFDDADDEFWPAKVKEKCSGSGSHSGCCSGISEM